MATLIGALGTPHGPMLATPPDVWDLRAQADRQSAQHWYRGQCHDYAGLLAARSPGYADAVRRAVQQRAHDACQRALTRLADAYRRLRPDLAVIVGNDQREVFLDDLTPAITVFTGARIHNIALDAAQRARLPPGIVEAEESHCPPEGAVYPGVPDCALQLAEALTERGFDISTSTRMPSGDGRQAGIPHAFGYVYRRIMDDAPPPSIPVFLNVGVAPCQLRMARCIALGTALHAAIRRLPDALRVLLVVSGGMTHFVLDEELDRRVLDALVQGDEAALAAIPEAWFNGNTAEVKSWLTVAFAARAAGLRMNVIDYVPCYRSEAGTGAGMAFVHWEQPA